MRILCPACLFLLSCGDVIEQPMSSWCSNANETPDPETGFCCNTVTGYCHHKPNEKIIFASSQLWTGDLGGIAGAHEKCQELALASLHTRGGDYLAWLSTSDRSPIENFRFEDGSVFITSTGTRIADNWIDLANGSLTAPIDKDEHGEQVGAYTQVWTGTNTSGSQGSQSCANWSSHQYDLLGNVGDASYANELWTYAENRSCNLKARIYCVEQ